MLLRGYCSGPQCFNFISLSTAPSLAPSLAIVNSECRCVHLPNGGMLCDPVGCEFSIVHVNYCTNTVPLLSAHCTTGDTANVKKKEQDKSKFNSLLATYIMHAAQKMFTQPQYGSCILLNSLKGIYALLDGSPGHNHG